MGTRYLGGYITATEQTPSTSSSTGVWDLRTHSKELVGETWQIPVPPSVRALFFGGVSRENVIDFFDTSSTGNATDFGDLTTDSTHNAACSSSTRAVRGGGTTNASFYGPTSDMETMDYVTISSAGNATDFGNLTTDRYRGDDGFSNSTRGIFGGGLNESDTKLNVIEYITIASTGNGTDFGDLGAATSDPASFCSSTRGVFAGGQISSSYTVTVQYITIGSTGNTTDFGDLTTATSAGPAGCSSATRGLFGGGYHSGRSNTIEYFTIASTGDATDFGDLTVARYYTGATSSSLRGVWGGGLSAAGDSNVLDYVTIASTGNATDFGNLTAATRGAKATSAAHGGLQ